MTARANGALASSELNLLSYYKRVPGGASSNPRREWVSLPGWAFLSKWSVHDCPVTLTTWRDVIYWAAT